MLDRDSAVLLWKYLELLIKQNGVSRNFVQDRCFSLVCVCLFPLCLFFECVLNGCYFFFHKTVVGTDIAELLLEGHEPSTAEFSRSGVSIGDITATAEPETADGGVVAANRTVISAHYENTDRFRHLLLHGRKKDALDWAMKNNLWGHALFLASKMDPKTHASIMTR